VESLHECIAISTGGVITQFAKLIGSGTATVSEWHRGEIRISLSGLLKICYCLDLSIIDFLKGKDAVRKRKINVKELPNAAYVVINRRTPRPFDRRKAEMELANFLNVEPPVSSAEAARTMGVNPRDLYRIFPELCRKISVRYKDYQQELYRIERVKREEEVRQAVTYLYSQGIYVSPRPVVKYLRVRFKTPAEGSSSR
jgi:transcriptional regulator with XRE-family HTH domain